MDVRTDRWMEKQTDGKTSRQADRQVDRLDSHTDRLADRQRDRQRETDKRTAGQANRWPERRTNRIQQTELYDTQNDRVNERQTNVETEYCRMIHTDEQT
jgi:hypothetical protein